MRSSRLATNNRQVFRRNSYERVTTDYQIARALRPQRPADLANPRYTPEKIIGMLRQAEVELVQNITLLPQTR
jgi:hypothetical protein